MHGNALMFILLFLFSSSLNLLAFTKIIKKFTKVRIIQALVILIYTSNHACFADFQQDNNRHDKNIPFFVIF